ncbi:MAG: hypothetical protein ABJM36_15960 [Algibacter sp.]|uniref:hypothetical protein n=1 Tax=Algibacter sp. TaxID=1872428 RepID=UPI00329A6974
MSALNEIIREKQSAEAALFKLKGVTGVDVGYKYTNGKRTDEITIRVHVKQKKKTVASKEKIPTTINGIKTDVIEMEVYPQILSQKLENLSLQADTATYTTVKGGVSIGPERSISTPDGNFVYTGTLGCIAKDNVTNNPVLLSNFHVMCIDNTWSVGDFMCQPSRVDTGSPVTDRVGALERALLSSHVDGAISTLNGRPHDCSIVDIGDVKGTAAAVLNTAVRKRGRTTLFTEGFVDAINATVNVDYGPGIGVKTLTDQIGIRPDENVNPKFSAKGDSGSVVVNADNKVIGLLFAGNDAGYTYINPISFVLSELNISLCVKLTKSVLKDAKDTIKDIKEVKLEKVEKSEKIEKLENKENKELKKEKLEKVEKLESKEFKKELKEIKKELQKEFPDNKGVISDKVDKPITDKLDKPYDGGNKLREISDRFNPGLGNFNASGNSIEDRLSQIEQSLSALTAFIGSDLRPDLSTGALTNEQDIAAMQEKMNKDIADSIV